MKDVSSIEPCIEVKGTKNTAYSICVLEPLYDHYQYENINV